MSAADKFFACVRHKAYANDTQRIDYADSLFHVERRPRLGRSAFEVAGQILVTGLALSSANVVWPGKARRWDISLGPVSLYSA